MLTYIASHLTIVKVIAFEDLKFHHLSLKPMNSEMIHLEVPEKWISIRRSIAGTYYKRGTWHDAIIHGLLAKDINNGKH